VLGSLRGRDAQSGFAGLNGDQMKAVYAASVDKNVSMTGGARVGGGQSGVNTNITYDTRGYDRIAVAAASVPDAHVKAQVFAAGTQTIRDTRIDNTVLARMTGISPESSQGAVARMGNSLARIIDSNPQAVVADLSNFDAKGRAGAISTDGGTPLATYAKAMIQSGAEGRGRLGAQLGMIAAGDGRQANATATFNHQVNERYQTATSLGYFAGAVASASKAIDTDVAAQRELLTGVLQSGLSIVDKGVGNNPMAAIAKDWLGTAMGSLIDNPASDVASVLADAATPTENGYRTDRSAPFSAFEAKLGEVMREALP
jgi:hypothetical protein